MLWIPAIPKTGDTETANSTYDGLVRLIALQDGGGHITNYCYDLNGRLTRVTYPDSTTSQAIAFDADDRVLTRLDGMNNSISYLYNDAEGLLTDIYYPSSMSNLDVHLTYDSDNRRIGMTDGSGASSTTYDTIGDPLTVTTAYTGAAPQTLSYTYNPDGSRATMSAPAFAGSHTFSYSSMMAGGSPVC